MNKKLLIVIFRKTMRFFQAIIMMSNLGLLAMDSCTSLNITTNKPEDFNTLFDNSEAYTALETLSLEGCLFHNVDAVEKFSKGIVALTALQKIIFSDFCFVCINNTYERFNSLMDPIKKNPTIKSLELYQCAIKENGAQYAKTLIDNTNLTSLSCWVNALGVSPVKVVEQFYATLLGATNLQHIDLVHVESGQRGIEALQQYLRNTPVSNIRITYTSLGPSQNIEVSLLDSLIQNCNEIASIGLYLWRWSDCHGEEVFHSCVEHLPRLLQAKTNLQELDVRVSIDHNIELNFRDIAWTVGFHSNTVKSFTLWAGLKSQGALKKMNLDPIVIPQNKTLLEMLDDEQAGDTEILSDEPETETEIPFLSHIINYCSIL